MKRILLVEDDVNFGSVLKSYLELNGYVVMLCVTGDKGFTALKTGEFDLCIFDIMLPGMDGFRLAEEKQAFRNEIPFIFLTAKTLKDDIIKGYNMGADDYITKPFDTDLLLLKINAIILRDKKNKSTITDEFLIGKYRFQHSLRNLGLNEKKIQISQREADLLKQLCIHRNELLPKDKALNLIWGDNSYFNSRSMDVYITRLRKYLSEDPDICIQSIHGSGYRFVVPD